MIAFRPATPDDVPAIVAMQVAPHARDFVLPATPAEVRAALDNPARATFTIADDGETVGSFNLSCEPDLPWLVELRRIVVVRPGRGYGTAALDFVVEWAFAQRGAHRISLEVEESNARARHVYERAGFVYEGTWRDGFRGADGTYKNLCMYGLLAGDPRPRSAAAGNG